MSILISYTVLFVGLGLNYLLNIVIGRALGPSEYGQYVFALNLYNTVTLITVFGLDQAAIKFLPQSEKPKEYVNTILILSIILVTVSVIITSIVINIIPITNNSLYLLFLVAVIPAVFLTHVLAIAQANHILISRMTIRYLMEPILRAILLCLIFFFWIKSSVGPACAILLSTSISCIFSIYIYRRKLHFSVKQNKKYEFRKILHFVVPLAGGNVLNILAGRMDIIIVGAALINHEVGIYTAGLQSAAMVALILQGVELVYASLLSKSIGNDNQSKLLYDYKTSLRITILFGAPLVIFLSFYKDFTSMLFGAEFIESQLILAILCISQFANLATGSANQLLILFGYTRTVFLLNAAFLILVSSLVYVGAQKVGIVGAAIGIMCSSALLNIARVLLIFIKKKIHPYDASCGVFIALTVAMLISRVILDLQFKLWETVTISSVIAITGIMLLMRKSDLEWVRGNIYRIRVGLSG